MYFIVEPHNQHQVLSLMDQMFRLRAKVFADELGWVQAENGEERDVYDTFNPAYLMHTDPTGQHLYACVRLMPSHGPTLLADTFADTLPDAVAFQTPLVWEATRLCINDDLIRAHGRDHQRLDILRHMLLAGLEFGVMNGVEAYLSNFDDARLRMWRWAGARIDVVGTTARFGAPVHLGLMEVSLDALATLRCELGWPVAVLSKVPDQSARAPKRRAPRLPRPQGKLATSLKTPHKTLPAAPGSTVGVGACAPVTPS